MASPQVPWRDRIERRYADGLQRKGWVYWIFLIFSWMFRWFARRRRQYFLHHPDRSVQLPVPVIIVGNIVAGGTGKTPVVIALTQALRRHGAVPGVISRGYRSRNSDTSEVLAVESTTSPQCCGDEALLVAQRTLAPVFVHPQRLKAAYALLKKHPEVNVLIFDDGLQHYAVARQFELVVFGRQGVGNGAYLPAGPLRESIGRERDATLFVAADPVPGLSADAPAFHLPLVPDALYRLSQPEVRLDLASLQGRHIAAFAGIGDPEKFFHTLRHAGAVVDGYALPDHYHFLDDPFQQTLRDMIVITEKDAVKCALNPAYRNDPRLWVLPVSVQLDDSLVHLILTKLSSSNEPKVA